MYAEFLLSCGHGLRVGVCAKAVWSLLFLSLRCSGVLRRVAPGVAGCARINGEDYVHNSPPFDLKAYFNGPIKAWGLVQDRSGKVIQQFDIVMQGSWQGNQGTLVEDFSFMMAANNSAFGISRHMPMVPMKAARAILWIPRAV